MEIDYLKGFINLSTLCLIRFVLPIAVITIIGLWIQKLLAKKK